MQEIVTSQSGIVEAPSFLLVFILSGRATVRLDGKPMLAREGAVFALPRGTQGTHEQLHSLRVVSWAIDDDFIAAHAQWMPSTHPLSTVVESATAVPPQPGMMHLSSEGLQIIRAPLLELAALERRDLLTHYDRLSRTAAILDLLDPHHRPRAYPWSSPNAPRRAEVTKAIRLIEEAIDHPWSIDELAALVALSPSQLSRLFRTALGVSPGAYLWNRRVEVMAELLATLEITVTEAVRKTGWRSRSAATRAFRGRYGVSPRDFTRRAAGRLD